MTTAENATLSKSRLKRLEKGERGERLIRRGERKRIGLFLQTADFGEE